MRRFRRSAAKTQAAQSSGARHAGVVTLEVVVVLPLLVIVFFAIFEFGLIALVFAAATEAVVDGAPRRQPVVPSHHAV